MLGKTNSFASWVLSHPHSLLFSTHHNILTFSPPSPKLKGAGCSVAAGLPLWGKLLDDLAVDAQMTERERKSMEELTFLDRARIIEKRLGGSAQLTQAIARRLEGKYYALAHAFIQALPGKGTPSFLPSPPPPNKLTNGKS